MAVIEREKAFSRDISIPKESQVTLKMYKSKCRLKRGHIQNANAGKPNNAKNLQKQKCKMDLVYIKQGKLWPDIFENRTLESKASVLKKEGWDSIRSQKMELEL